MEDKVPSFFRFEDLRIYGKAVDYNRWLLSTLKEPRNEGERNLCRSFANSSIDISLNIAEGSSRNKSQFEHYLKISKTAIRECIIYTTICNGLGLFTEEDANQSREFLMEMTRMIGALIISLQRGSRRSREESESMGSSDLFPDDTESGSDSDFSSDFDALGN